MLNHIYAASPRASEAPVFRATRPLGLAEHLGVPCLVTSAGRSPRLGQLQAPRGSSLLWPEGLDPTASSRRSHRVWLPTGPGKQISVFAAVADDDTAARLLTQAGGQWSPLVGLTDEQGVRVGSVWRERDGSIFLPFDPDAVCLNFWSERYLRLNGRGMRAEARHRLMRTYYLLRGAVPRPAQIFLRRQFARVQGELSFPAWPAEPALHDFFELFLGVLADVAGQPVPYLHAWPGGKTWAFVLTHDVEGARGVAAIDPVLELERAHGVRSSWNFTPRRYDVEDRLVQRLREDGFEVGVHGLYHDGRDMTSLPRLNRRLPAIRAAAARWGAVGYRSPSTHRNWEWMPLLGFDYDSSYPDTDPFEPQDGGCCTWLPFFNQNLVELPLTLPQDHTLFVILAQTDGRVWQEKTELLRRRGGMALMLTHPDYLLEAPVMAAYGEYLERFAGDPTAWRALPRDVSAWWRRRAASTIELTREGHVVRGPAAEEATIDFAEGSPWS